MKYNQNNYPNSRKKVAEAYGLNRVTIQKYIRRKPVLRSITPYKRLSFADFLLFVQELGSPPDPEEEG